MGVPPSKWIQMDGENNAKSMEIPSFEMMTGDPPIETSMSLRGHQVMSSRCRNSDNLAARFSSTNLLYLFSQGQLGMIHARLHI